MGMHSLTESHSIAEIMEKKEKKVLFILSYFFQVSFQTSVLASLERNLDSRPKLYGPCNVPTCVSSRECQNPNQEQGWLHARNSNTCS